MFKINYSQEEDIIYVERFGEIDLLGLLSYIRELDLDFKDRNVI